MAAIVNTLPAELSLRLWGGTTTIVLGTFDIPLKVEASEDFGRLVQPLAVSLDETGLPTVATGGPQLRFIPGQSHVLESIVVGLREFADELEAQR